MALQGILLAPQATHKFLGILLDQELCWNHQSGSTIVKASKWVMAFRRLARPSAGVCPRLKRQLYNVVAVQKMTYVADVWYTPVNKQAGGMWLSGLVGIMGKLSSLQRIWMATLAIT